MSSSRRAVPHRIAVRRVGVIGPLEVAADTSQAITPTGASVTVTAGTPAFALNITPTGATVTVTAGTVTVAQAITPTGVTVTVTAGTATLVSEGPPRVLRARSPWGFVNFRERKYRPPTARSRSILLPAAQPITPVGATVTVTPGTATVVLAQSIAPTGPTVTVTPGTPAFDLGQLISPSALVTVTPGTPTLTLNVTPTGATVTVTAGTASVSLTITVVGATVTVTAGTAAVAFGVPDPNPITMAVLDRGHTVSLNGHAHSHGMRDRGHTVSIREHQ